MTVHPASPQGEALHLQGDVLANPTPGFAPTRQGCFLCALDPHPCTQMQLEGRIVSARERVINGETMPIIMLDSGTFYVSLTLTRYYRTLVKELAALSTSMNQLMLRVYHLPGSPGVGEYRGRPLHRYTANSYTLAVLEPDTLLNITDLNSAEYCPRQYLLQRLAPSQATAATIRGNLVHACFKELLKEHDRGELMAGHIAGGQETPLATLQRHLEKALERSSLELDLAHLPAETMRAEAAPHLESLATWYHKQSNMLWDMPATHAGDQADTESGQRSENTVRAETFLLAPEIGLKGRLDLLWQQAGRQRLLELKTGGGNGELPRRAHRWQVYGYHALLTVRRDPRMKKALATLLYSGTPVEAQAFGIPFSVRELQLVNERRNTLVLSHVTGIPPAPPGPSRCTKCAMLQQCEQVSSLLGWQPPQPDAGVKADATSLPEAGDDDAQPPLADSAASGPMNYPYGSTSSSPRLRYISQDAPFDKRNVVAGLAPARPELALFTQPENPHLLTTEEREFFATYYHLLHLEGLAGEQQQALLWRTSLAERVERGTAISDLHLLHVKPTGQGEWVQTFACVNNSELREGDEILLSDGNPVSGEVVTGSIASIRSEQVKVWTPELIAHPTLIDRYGTDVVQVRTLQNLLRWLQVETRMRGLVTGRLRPAFHALPVPARADFNTEQNLAVERAMQMQDYLLIHGPPGTGKTSVIAEIVKRLCRQGQRVMLAAFTNQAVDNMLKRLDEEGVHDYVRLGHDRSVDSAVQKRLLKALVAGEGQDGPVSENPAMKGATVDEVLRGAPVIASTTATWSSEKYTPASLNGMENDSPFQFDVAIIDEAGQLTVPAILGALRFAKRFILVGDEKQLPPLVLSKKAADAGLAHSLFSDLKQKDDDYKNGQPTATGACVALRIQYRMHRQISDFASRTFYNGQLIPHPSVASRVLKIAKAGIRSAAAPAFQRAIHPGYPMVFVDVRAAKDGEADRTRGPQSGGSLGPTIKRVLSPPGTGPTTFQASAPEGAKISNVEARMVRAIVAELLTHGITESEIGIIAPYRAQVANLRRHIFGDDAESGWEGLASASSLSIDTVDRFQGGERKVIIISFATSTPPAAESLQREFLTNPNRLNVALTRAQRKLILVGCAPALSTLPIFQHLLAYCLRLNTIIPHIRA